MPHSEYYNPEGAQATEPLRWFSKHPLVSTVLWVFGAQQQQQQVQPSKSSNRLSWVDEHGGQLNQYYGEAGVRTSVHNGVYSALERKESDDRSTAAESDDDQNQDDSIDTISPQWGFYVSITPPQEVYPKSPNSASSH